MTGIGTTTVQGKERTSPVTVPRVSRHWKPAGAAVWSLALAGAAAVPVWGCARAVPWLHFPPAASGGCLVFPGISSSRGLGGGFLSFISSE